MRRITIAILTTLLMVLGIAGTALADVHAISQANCGNSDSSGATRSREAPGRPAGPIPVNASGSTLETFPGQGGAAGAQGMHC